ncbi:MAG: substrate-binding domain-containing protein [Lentisphaeria bacterium]
MAQGLDKIIIPDRLRGQRQNKAQEISECIRQDIVNGKFPSGTLLASNLKLAKRFEVAPLTANKAMNFLVSEGLVIRKQGCGSYVAPNIRSKQTARVSHCLAIIDSFNYNDPAHNAAITTFSETMILYTRKLGHQIRLLPYGDICQEETARRELRGVDGILLSASCCDPLTEGILAKLKIPVVLYLRDGLGDAAFHQVSSDLGTGMREAVDFLLSRNCHELILFYETHQNGLSRRHALLQAISDVAAPIMIKEEIAFAERSIQGIEVYKKGLELAEKIRGNMIFCTSDIVALLLIQAFQDQGMQLQHDYQLVSIDNLEAEHYTPFGHPILTSIDYPRKIIAQKAVDLLLYCIDKPDDCRYIVRVPTRLIRRS